MVKCWCVGNKHNQFNNEDYKDIIITDKPLTIGQLKKWYEDNDISDDTPIGIYLGDSERGSVAFGVVGDTKSEYNDDYYVTNLTETTGEQFVYEFLPSGIVKCQTVKCMCCGKEFTDYVD